MADHIRQDAAKVAAWQRCWERDFRPRWVEHDGKFYPRGATLPGAEETARRQRIREASRLVRQDRARRLLERRERNAARMRETRAETEVSS